MSYEIVLSREAAKALKRADARLRRRFQDRLERLAEDPFDPRLSSQLVEPPTLRKSRVGDWRIIYAVDAQDHTLTVVSLVTRGHAYRD